MFFLLLFFIVLFSSKNFFVWLFYKIEEKYYKNNLKADLVSIFQILKDLEEKKISSIILIKGFNNFEKILRYKIISETKCKKRMISFCFSKEIKSYDDLFNSFNYGDLLNFLIIKKNNKEILLECKNPSFKNKLINSLFFIFFYYFNWISSIIFFFFLFFFILSQLNFKLIQLAESSIIK